MGGTHGLSSAGGVGRASTGAGPQPLLLQGPFPKQGLQTVVAGGKCAQGG